MITSQSRRSVLKGGLAVAGLGALGLPEWALPVLAQGEVLVPFTDLPETFPAATADRRQLDIRKIDGPLTPKDQFFTTQHYGHPEIDPAAFRLKVTGLVDRPLSLSLDALRGMRRDRARRRLRVLGQPASAAGSLEQRPMDRRTAAYRARPGRRESRRRGSSSSSAPITAKEEVEFRTQKYKVDQQFGRSLSREKALSPEPLLAYALNGEPLTRHQGSPLRLLVPGWYGVANVKWLSHIHLQEDQYLGKYQARWYRTLRGETIDGEVQWKEAAVTHMQLKSFIARVTRDGNRHKVLGVILNDGTADSIRRGQGGRRAVAAGDDRSRDQRQVLVEALQLHVDRRDAWRAHARVARDRRDRRRAAHGRSAGEQEDLPRGQLAASAKGHDRVSNGVRAGRGAGSGPVLAPLNPSNVLRSAPLRDVVGVYVHSW